MENVSETEMELYYWQMSDHASNFSAKLFELIGKADNINRQKLALGFPEEVKVMNRFQNENGYWANLVNRIKAK